MTSEFINQRNEVRNLILEAVKVDKIYLIGYTVTEQRTKNIFTTNDSGWNKISHYYVLMLVGKDEACNRNAVQDKIESRCGRLIPVTAIALDADQFQNWLREGHPFAYSIYTNAEYLYNGGNITLVEPQAIDEKELNKKNEVLLNQGTNKVQEFIAGADLYRIREQNKMAAFMLHQAAEQALITVLKVTTGLHLNTHSIDRLIRCCTLISDMFSAIFPRNNGREERLFQLIQKAYIGARYKEDYSVGSEHLLILTERVRALEKLVKEVCSNGLKAEHLADPNRFKNN